MTSPFTDDELRAYAAALQRAIEHHCRGLLVPDDIAQECPLHAKKLNGALCAEARRDARRYRFVRVGGIQCPNCVSQFTCRGPHMGELIEGDLDAAIDAALAEGK